MTVRDAVEMRQAVETQVSPDGERTAVVVTEPSVATNTITSRVLVTDAATGRDTRTVVAETDEASRITNLRWSPDGESLTYISARDAADEIWSVALDGGDPERVVEDLPPAVMIGGRHVPFDALIPPHPAKVLAFAWSPDGRYLAYTTPHLDKADSSGGVVYDDETMSLFNLALSTFDKGKIRLWIRDTDTGQTRRIADLGAPPLSGLGVGGLDWSPDSETLAITRMTGREPGVALAIVLETVDVDSGELTRVTTQHVTSATAPVWSPDGRHVLGQRGSTLVGIPVDGGEPIDLATLPAEAGYLTGLWWSSDGRTIAATAVASREYVYVGQRGTELAPVARGNDDLSVCDFDAYLARGLCARQDIDTPPGLATVNVTDGKLRVAEDINPQLRKVRVVQPQPTQWKNKYGSVATGYEIVPDECRRRGSCPVVVITHGSDARNKFMDPAHEWDYPSQVFAARGYVVLLVNETKYPVPGVPWEEQKLNLGMDAVATMQRAVRRAVTDGYADPDQTGIMGYSHGFQTGSLAITHTDTFHAASLSNGSDGNATYWLAGRKDLRDYWASIYGGNPVDPKSRGHWQELDPAMNTDKIDAPLLMQFNEIEGLIALQQYSFLRDRGQPVELVIFPDDNHLFYQPQHRAAAMSQNLDWFDYWLLNRRAPDPAKAAQYKRWDQLKQRWHD